MRLSIAFDEDGTVVAAPLSDADIQKMAAVAEAEILISSPPRPAGRRFIAVAALVLLAAVGLRLWLPSNSTEPEPGPVASSSAAVPPWAPADPQQLAATSGQASCGWNAATDHQTTYVQFCQNSRSLCAPAPPTPVVQKQRWGQ